MGKITYDQFLILCKKCGFTVDQGAKAITFASLAIGQYFINSVDYVNKGADDNHTNLSKTFTKKQKDDAQNLMILYGQFHNDILSMLIEHDESIKANSVQQNDCEKANHMEELENVKQEERQKGRDDIVDYIRFCRDNYIYKLNTWGCVEFLAEVRRFVLGDQTEINNSQKLTFQDYIKIHRPK